MRAGSGPSARRIEIYRGAVGRQRKLCRSIEVHDVCVGRRSSSGGVDTNLHFAR